MNTRPDWKETSIQSTSFNLKWQPFSKGIRFDQLNERQKQMVNHVECHYEITTKDCLFKNISIYCELNKLNAFDYVPLTFAVDIDNPTYNYDLERFMTCYNIISNGCALITDSNDEAQITRARKSIDSNIRSLVTNKERRKVRSSVPYLFKTHFQGKNLWIIKPTGLNRGRGVQVFKTLEEMKQIIKESTEGIINADLKPEINNDPENDASDAQAHPANIPAIKSRSFVIQKYIESPLLINKRKFDIRVWMLLTHEGKSYFFKEGYLRMSSYEYSTDTNNKEIHLTNNAIQKNTQKYGLIEDGNQLSFDEFQKYIDTYHAGSKVSVRNELYPKMKEFVNLTLQCSRKKLNPTEKKHCFEIFGYDFMIDSEFHLWLIEINTNPCLEESSTLLKMLIQRMLDDAFKLTVDSLFPKKKKKEVVVLIQQAFKVENYKDDENMWDYITQIGLIKTTNPTLTKIRKIDCIRNSKDTKVVEAIAHEEMTCEKDDETRIEY